MVDQLELVLQETPEAMIATPTPGSQCGPVRRRLARGERSGVAPGAGGAPWPPVGYLEWNTPAQDSTQNTPAPGTTGRSGAELRAAEVSAVARAQWCRQAENHDA